MLLPLLITQGFQHDYKFRHMKIIVLIVQTIIIIIWSWQSCGLLWRVATLLQNLMAIAPLDCACQSKVLVWNDPSLMHQGKAWSTCVAPCKPRTQGSIVTRFKWSELHISYMAHGFNTVIMYYIFVCCGKKHKIVKLMVSIVCRFCRKF